MFFVVIITLFLGVFVSLTTMHLFSFNCHGDDYCAIRDTFVRLPPQLLRCCCCWCCIGGALSVVAAAAGASSAGGTHLQDERQC